MNPPDHAVVFSFDEKPQIQALERAQPVLPMDLGMPERQTHNYVRHGTLDLFAALNVATGEVIAKTKQQHRGKDFVAFLRELDKEVEDELQVHVILDNLSAHKSPVFEGLFALLRGCWSLRAGWRPGSLAVRRGVRESERCGPRTTRVGHWTRASPAPSSQWGAGGSRTSRVGSMRPWRWAFERRSCDANRAQSSMGTPTMTVSAPEPSMPLTTDRTSRSGVRCRSRAAIASTPTRGVVSGGGGLWLRLGRVDGVRVDAAVSGLGGARGGSFLFLGSIRIPVFAAESVRVWLEGRTEVSIPSPVFVMLTGGVRARVGKFLIGFYAPVVLEQPSVLLSLGIRL